MHTHKHTHARTHTPNTHRHTRSTHSSHSTHYTHYTQCAPCRYNARPSTRQKLDFDNDESSSEDNVDLEHYIDQDDEDSDVQCGQPSRGDSARVRLGKQLTRQPN